MAKTHVLIFAFLFLACATSVWPEVKVVPNFTYLQAINNQNRLDDDIKQYLRDVLCVSSTEIRLNNNCRLSPLKLRITLNNDNNCPATGLEVFLRTAAGRKLSKNTDNHGKAAFRNLEIRDYPLTVNIPLTGYQAGVASPIEQLVDTIDIVKHLNNCPDNRTGIYDALFLKLLLLTRDKHVLVKANIIRRHCRNISLDRICNEIRDYLSRDDITHNIRRGLTRDCPGVRNCLP